MSTSEIYLDAEEIADFIRTTQNTTSLNVYGYEGQEYGVCPFITFYILQKEGDADFERIAKQMITVYEEFKSLIDEPLRKIWKDSTQVWLKAGDKRLPSDLHEEMQKAKRKGESFWIQATDADSHLSSACWAIEAKVPSHPEMRYATLKMTFRYSWYLENKAQWHTFVNRWLDVLQPDQCYSSFEVGNTGGGADGAYELNVMERICTDYFYGLDIDHPGKMGFHHDYRPDLGGDVSDLSSGLRTPTWSFLLSPHWLAKLGLDETGLYVALAGTQANITPFRRSDGRGSYWIELGELSLYPVENGVPSLLVAANRLSDPFAAMI